MHVLSRRQNEGLVIGEDIVVTVLEVHADRVRLAIFSPRHVPSYWEEDLYLSQAEEELAAASPKTRELLSVRRW